MRVAVNLAPEGADEIGFIEVLYNGDLGAGYASEVSAVIFPSLGVFVGLVA